MKQTIFLLAVLFVASALSLRPTNHQLLFSKYKSVEDNVPELYFTQTLDHFNPQDDRVYKQRYFANAEFWKGNGPIFIFVGGEGPIAGSAVTHFQMSKWAKQYGALQFAVEHRYYGKSTPFSAQTPENLKYLSSQQALADLADFIHAMVLRYNIDLEKNKIITFGGSYPGALSAWFRLKYPHMAHAAIASSAPIQAELDFVEYYQVVFDTLYSEGGSECTSVVQKGVQQAANLVKQRDFETIQKLFPLCNVLTNDEKDMQTFMSLLTTFVSVVQYNEEGAFPFTVKSLCNQMTSSSRAGVEPLAILYNVTAAMSEGCLDASYQNMISEMKNALPASADAAMTLWTYQTCREFGYYQTSDRNDLFLDMPLQYSLDICKDVFGLEQGNVSLTNDYYGGRDIKGSRIVFPNGSYDPWHALGLLEDKPNEQTAVFIQGTAHCADMHVYSEGERPALTAGRNRISNLLDKLLLEEE
eukprot:GCRY01000327.1.p1 GENE.GCRY01000327.1~~GCRY01000327.1.p1  ORF type:complete len:490 (-),score=102.84 GCRY01000327.1:68-1480(-)